MYVCVYVCMYIRSHMYCVSVQYTLYQYTLCIYRTHICVQIHCVYVFYICTLYLTPSFMILFICIYTYMCMCYRLSRGVLRYERSASRTLSMADCARNRYTYATLTYILYVHTYMYIYICATCIYNILMLCIYALHIYSVYT